MKRSDVKELHYIAHIENVPPILEHGILSHNLIEKRKIKHCSVAMEGIQDRRKDKQIPGTSKLLHDYVNLYFDAHNPMLSVIREHNDTLCVLSMDDKVMDLPGVIITDQNASRDITSFHPSPQGLMYLNRDRLYADFWLHDNPIEKDRHKGQKCAEVLVLNCVELRFVRGAYVANKTAESKLKNLCPDLPVKVKSAMFF